MTDTTQPQTVNLNIPIPEPTKFEKGVGIASTVIVLASFAVPAGLLSYSLAREIIEDGKKRKAAKKAAKTQSNVVKIDK